MTITDDKHAVAALSRELDASVLTWHRLAAPASAYGYPEPEGAPWRPGPGWRTKTRSHALDIDWRSKQAIFTPKDQGEHNTATSFALISVMADIGRIRRKDWTPLSAGYLHWCLAGLEGDQPLDPAVAVSLLLANDVPEYSKGDYPFPKERCGSKTGVARLAETRPIIDEVEAKRALQIGPVFGVMDLWEDFWRFYGSGIYRHAAGRYLGAHPLAVVGFDETERCWIVRNSRGTSWGDQGYASVAFGECRLFTDGGHGGMQLILT